MSVDLLDVDEVRHREDHAADLGPVLLDDDVADPLQTERPQGLPLVAQATDLRTGLGHLEAPHHEVTPARARSRAAGATSSIGRPRRAATDSGGKFAVSAKGDGYYTYTLGTKVAVAAGKEVKTHTVGAYAVRTVRRGRKLSRRLPPDQRRWM